MSSLFQCSKYNLFIQKFKIQNNNQKLKEILISSQENRQAKRHVFILIAVENAKQAELAIKKDFV